MMRSHSAWMLVVLTISTVGCNSSPVSRSAFSDMRSRMQSRSATRRESAQAPNAVVLSTKTHYQSPAAEINHRGMTYYQGEQIDKAVAAYTQAVQMDPRYASAYYNRAAAYYKQQKYGKAMTDLDHAIRLDPRHASAYHLRGMVHMSTPRAPDYAAAVADFQNAVKYDPSNVDSLNRLAYLLVSCPVEQHRDQERGAALAGHVCKLTDWKNSESLLVLSAAHAEAGDYKMAAKCARQASEVAAVKDKEQCLTLVNHYVQQHIADQKEKAISPYHAKAVLATIAQPFGGLPFTR